jgi:UDP:flavonoid glycosyltransferase YjiC (YdhE family)
VIEGTKNPPNIVPDGLLRAWKGAWREMNIIIPTLGSRGDVQLYINLGVELVGAGFDVTIATHSFWKQTIESFEINFYPLGPEVNFDVEVARVRRNFNIFAILKLLNNIHTVASRQLLEILPQFDLLVVSHTLLGALEAMKLNKPYISVTLVPTVIPVIATGTDGIRSRLQSFPNSFYFNAGPWGKIRKRYGLKSITHFHQLLSPDVNLIPISNHLYPHRPHWAENHVITGIWQLPGKDQALPDGLRGFLKNHECPIIVALGAMSFDTGQDVDRVQVMINAITKSGHSGIIQGFSNSVQKMDLPDNIFHLGPFPHDLLFKHGKLIIHHGGFGTTTTALYSGIPSITIPHVLDQFFWAHQLHALKLSPKPVPARRVSEKVLISAIEACVNDLEMIANTTRMMKNLKQENGLGKARALIENFVRENL